MRFAHCKEYERRCSTRNVARSLTNINENPVPTVPAIAFISRWGSHTPGFGDRAAL